jgi:hypothetical protein
MRWVSRLSLLLVIAGPVAAAPLHHDRTHGRVRTEFSAAPSSAWARVPPPRHQPAPQYDDQPDPRVDNPYKNWGG